MGKWLTRRKQTKLSEQIQNFDIPFAQLMFKRFKMGGGRRSAATVVAY